MENIWRRGPLTVNPYHENAFQALGLTPEVATRAEIDQRVGERRKAVKHKPGHYRLGERALTLDDVTTARKILLDPTRRIFEELLEHRPELLEVEEIERLARRMARLLPEASEPAEAGPRHLRFLLLAVPELLLAYFDELPPVELSLDLENVDLC